MTSYFPTSISVSGPLGFSRGLTFVAPIDKLSNYNMKTNAFTTSKTKMLANTIQAIINAGDRLIRQSLSPAPFLCMVQRIDHVPINSVMDSPPKQKRVCMEAADLPEGVLFGMGNPLLDISAEVPEEYLKKYDLKPNDAILASEKHMPIYKEMVDSYTVEYIAGGATQNTIRVAQWMLQRPLATSYLGCVGRDEFGEQLEKQAKKDGVRVSYLIDDKEPTGTCAVVITQKVRSLVANLGAANHYRSEHLKQEENWKMVEQAKVCYIAGFFLTVSVDSILAVAKHCTEKNKLFLMNLSAPFISFAFKDQLLQVMPYIDILIGNEAEGEAFGQVMGYETKDLKEILVKAANLPKNNKSRPRIAIFTQGPDPVLLYKDGKVSEWPILPITEEEILDTNGAGDAWVGGFLSQLVLERSVEDAISGGHYAANVIIKRSGCTFPPKPDFVLKDK